MSIQFELSPQTGHLKMIVDPKITDFPDDLVNLILEKVKGFTEQPLNDTEQIHVVMGIVNKTIAEYVMKGNENGSE